MSDIARQLHVGIYGVVRLDDKILVVRKSRGPYKGLYDLPGGRPLHGEPLRDTLRRELVEETGIHAEAFHLLDNISFTVTYQDADGITGELYHIALIYRVENADMTHFNPDIVKEDVQGSLWVPQGRLCTENSSPLLLAGAGARGSGSPICKSWDNRVGDLQICKPDPREIA